MTKCNIVEESGRAEYFFFLLNKQRPWRRKAIIEEKEGRIAGLRSTRFPLVETQRCFANLVQRADTISNESGNYKTAVESHRHRETHVALLPPPELPPVHRCRHGSERATRTHASAHARTRSLHECVSSRGLRASRFCIIWHVVVHVIIQIDLKIRASRTDFSSSFSFSSSQSVSQWVFFAPSSLHPDCRLITVSLVILTRHRRSWSRAN